MINVREAINEIPAQESIIKSKTEPCLKSAIKRYELIRKTEAMLEYELNSTDTNNLSDPCKMAYVELKEVLKKVRKAEHDMIAECMKKYHEKLL